MITRWFIQTATAGLTLLQYATLTPCASSAFGPVQPAIFQRAQPNKRARSQSDHSIRIGDRLVVDGRDRARDTAMFSPCHMNHSSRQANVGRHTQRTAGRVTFYTLRDVQARRLARSSLSVQHASQPAKVLT